MYTWKDVTLVKFVALASSVAWPPGLGLPNHPDIWYDVESRMEGNHILTGPTIGQKVTNAFIAYVHVLLKFIFRNN